MYKIDVDSLLEREFNGVVPEMPTDKLAYEVVSISRHFAGVLNTNLNYVLTSMFTCFGECLGKEVKSVHNAYTNKANLYTLLVGDSGDAKSPTMQLVMDFLNHLDHKNEVKFENLYDACLESEKKVLPQFEEQMVAENVTIEKLYSILNATKNKAQTGVLLSLDEATTFFSPGATIKSKTGAVVPHILTMFSAPYLKVDRVYLGKPLYIKNPMLSILASTQYDNLGGMFNGFRGSGFSSRWLFSLPSKEVERVEQKDSYRQYWEESQERAITTDSLQLQFANDLQIDEINDALKKAVKELRRYDGELASYVIKQNFYVHRLAVIIHCLNAMIVGDEPSSSIKEEEVDYAYRLCFHFTQNAKVCLDIMRRQDEIRLTGKDILRLLNEKWKISNFTALSEATGGKLDRAYVSKCINGSLKSRQTNGILNDNIC